MSLTVPIAGVSGGRAAQPQFETPQTGNVIAAFGDAVKGLGDKMEAERLDLEMGRLQIDMTRDLGAMRLKYEQMGDPEAIDAGWGKDIAALKQSYLGGKTATGRARVDPKLKARWELGFDDLAEKHAFAIGTNVMAIRQSQRLANHVEYEATAAQAAANSDPATRETIYAQSDVQIDALLASNAISPEAAATMKLSARQNGDFDALVNDLAIDPEKVRDGLAANAYPHLTPDQHARGEAALASQDEKSRVLAEKATADKLAGLKTSLTEGIKLVGDGRISTAESLVDNPVIQAAFPEQVAELRGAISLRDKRVDINRMTLPQLVTAAKQWSSTSFSADHQADGLRGIEARIDEVRTGQRTDPIGLWKGAEMGLSAIDFSSPETIGAGLAQRAVDVARLTESGHLTSPVFLDAEEAAQIKDMAGVTNDPAARLDLAMALQGAFGVADEDAVLAITGDETLAGVAGMLSAKAGNSVLGKQILAGQRIAAEKGLPLPSEGAWRETIGAKFGALFADGTVDGQHDENPTLQMLGSMTFGLYVYKKGAAADLSADTLDATLLEQSFHEVAGGTGTLGSSKATGGIQLVKGVKTIMPPGIRASDVDAALENLRHSLQFEGNARIGDFQSDPAFGAISVGRNQPRFSGMKIDADTFGSFYLRATTSGYNLVYFNPSTRQEEAARGDNGAGYEIDLDALLAKFGDGQ